MNYPVLNMNNVAEKSVDLQVIKILIVDDDEDDFFITSSYIKNITGKTFKIDWCYRYKEALDLICSGKYDIYLVDYRLGAKTGLDLLQDAVNNNCEQPIVLLTGKGTQEIDIKAMQAGAVDYLVKPELSTEKLERCIRYSLERAASFRALKANERKFRNIFERSKDAVFVADEKLYFKDINYAATELLGFDKAELLEMSLYRLLANHHDQTMIEQELSETGDIDDREVELITQNGEKKYCILSLSTESDINYNTYVQGIIHDITNLKRAEKANLQIEKLGVAGRLVRTLAHEVRNPLNNISLAAQQLVYDVPEDPSQLYLDIIKRNSKRIGDLIVELLDSSRPADIMLDRSDLCAILDDAVGAAVDRITLKKIKLQVKYPGSPAFIMADPSKLKIAFLNIIINAVEAMEGEKGELVVDVKTKGGEHVVSIADNGTGISEENLSRLFEPYFTSKRNGLGLGLAATLNILQSHKASVDVKSIVGEGTNFLLTFKEAGI